MAAKTFAAFALCMLAAAHAQSDAAAAPFVVMVDSTSRVVVRARLRRSLRLRVCGWAWHAARPARRGGDRLARGRAAGDSARPSF